MFLLRKFSQRGTNQSRNNLTVWNRFPQDLSRCFLNLRENLKSFKVRKIQNLGSKLLKRQFCNAYTWSGEKLFFFSSSPSNKRRMILKKSLNSKRHLNANTEALFASCTSWNSTWWQPPKFKYRKFKVALNISSWVFLEFCLLKMSKSYQVFNASESVITVRQQNVFFHTENLYSLFLISKFA